MSDKITFPLTHEVYKSCSIKPEELIEIAARFNLPLERTRAAVTDMAAAMRDGTLPALRTASKLRRFIRNKIAQDIKPREATLRSRLMKSFAENPDAKFAVFRRSASGRAAYFQALHPDEDKAREVARLHASESVSLGHKDFTYFVIELKHRVGIENGKPVDEAL